jgi:hypothetical protein
MKFRFSISVAARCVAVVSFLAACGTTDTPSPETGGSSSGGTGTAAAGAAGGSGQAPGGSGGTVSSVGGHAGGGMSGGAGAGAAGHAAGGSSAGATSSGGGAGMGSGGTGNTGSTVDPTWDTVKLVLTGTHPPCNGADCHGPGGPNIFQLPVKDDAALYTSLTTHMSVDCGNIPVVTPGDPSKSALVKVLNGPCSAKVPQMPNGCTPADGNCLEPEYIAAVTTWVANGAPH